MNKMMYGVYVILSLLNFFTIDKLWSAEDKSIIIEYHSRYGYGDSIKHQDDITVKLYDFAGKSLLSIGAIPAEKNDYFWKIDRKNNECKEVKEVDIIECLVLNLEKICKENKINDKNIYKRLCDDNNESYNILGYKNIGYDNLVFYVLRQSSDYLVPKDKLSEVLKDNKLYKNVAFIVEGQKEPYGENGLEISLVFEKVSLSLYRVVDVYMIQYPSEPCDYAKPGEDC
jgi:hypothetical protein